VIIAGAGGAAHLPGMIAPKTLVPVLGVRSKRGVSGLAPLLHGAAFRRHAGHWQSGCANAALLAAQILASTIKNCIRRGLA
jgi:phosphoribosylcarboxyaminoimidazole (NCAIR) mutase